MKTYKVLFINVVRSMVDVSVEANSPEEAINKFKEAPQDYQYNEGETLEEDYENESVRVIGEWKPEANDPRIDTLERYPEPIFLKKETTIREILDRMDQGQDCTDEESAEIKGYLKEQFALEFRDIPLIDEILFLFPVEYREAEEEFAK